MSGWWSGVSLMLGLGLGLGLAPVAQASAAEGHAAAPRVGLLRMRASPPEVLDADARRAYAGPTAITDQPGRTATWNPRGEGEDEDATEGEDASEGEGEGEDATQTAADETGETAASSASPGPAVTATVPPPSSVRDVPEHVMVAVGLAPEAPGSREEKALLDALENSARASTNPTTDVRRLRPGAGAPRRLCREHRDDLVVMIGYVADRETPVVLAHDCRLDQALSVRAADAARSPELMQTLWREHLQLLQAGGRERRRVTVGPRARAGIIAGVAIVVVGVAVGALVANALREESVVITVRP